MTTRAASLAAKHSDSRRSNEQARAPLRVLEAVSRHRDRERLFVEIASVLRSITSFDALIVKLHGADPLTPYFMHPRMAMLARRARASGVELPLCVQDRVIATLQLQSDRPRAYDDLDVQLANEVAAAIALALDNCLAHERIARLDAEKHVIHAGPARTQSQSLVAESPAMQEVMHLVHLVAPTDATVLIAGDTGAGKERLARLIHQRSSRSDQPMLAINCAAIPTSLIESELFGHEAGAFTGATRRHRGRFELAHGGTLLLDEVGELPLEAQAKLLRVLQNGEIDRIGSKQPTHVDVRVIAATNRPLFEMVRTRQFRDDLYYRLAIFPIQLPPLSARQEDIPILARHLVDDCARRLGFPPPHIDEETLRALRRHAWPGNVRELQNLIERAMIWSRGGELDIAAMLDATTAPGQRVACEPPCDQKSEMLDVLRECSWVIEGQLGAARRLGLKPSTLRARMRKLGIERSP